MDKPIIQHFFDQDTNTFSYVVTDPETRQCAIIDSVLDYDIFAACVSTKNADKIIDYIKLHDFKVQWILETHVHAEHLSASQYLKQKLGGKVAMSRKIRLIQKVFSKIYNLDPKTFNSDKCFDYLFKDNEAFQIGNLDAYNIPTPGHTPACLSYVIDDAVFVGDTLFMPDYGTARCDFPKGSAEELFDSIKKLYELPDHTQVYLCHDYLPDGREKFICKTDILTQKMNNVHIQADTKKAKFVSMRKKKDETLTIPKLMLPAIQINMAAGRLPDAQDNNIQYLKIPLNYF